MYFITHNSYDVAPKYSIISTEKNVKLSYLNGSVDKNNVYFHMTCLLPNKKQEEIYKETIDRGRVTETWVAEIL